MARQFTYKPIRARGNVNALAERRRPKMVEQRQHWVVSPNVNGKGNKVEEWKEKILDTRAAIMGWSPKDPIGQRFEKDIQIGDIVLIVRGKKSADITCLGVVKRKSRQRHFPTILEGSCLCATLGPFHTAEASATRDSAS